jgi:hypothetical protein
MQVPKSLAKPPDDMSLGMFTGRRIGQEKQINVRAGKERASAVPTHSRNTKLLGLSCVSDIGNPYLLDDRIHQVGAFTGRSLSIVGFDKSLANEFGFVAIQVRQGRSAACLRDADLILLRCVRKPMLRTRE